MEDIFNNIKDLAEEVFPQQVTGDGIPIPSMQNAVCLTAHNNLIYYDQDEGKICCYGLYA